MMGRHERVVSYEKNDGERCIFVFNERVFGTGNLCRVPDKLPVPSFACLEFFSVSEKSTVRFP
jgi:hypothetical protein